MKRIRRKKYVVDKRLQFTMAFQVVLVMLSMAVLYVVALFALSNGTLAEQDAEGTRSYLFLATGIYFVLTTAILATLAMITSNRVAGPAYVVRRALDAMREGDYDQRIELRTRDSHKKLAASAMALRDHLQARDLKLEALATCFEEGDHEAVREILADLVVAAEAAELESAPV